MKSEIKISVYQSTNPASFMHNYSVKEVIDDIKSDAYKESTNTLRTIITNISKHPDESGAKKNLKEIVNLYKGKHFQAVAWSGEFGKELAGSKGLINHSGLICIDIDDLPADRLPILIKKLNEDLYTHVLFISPSGNGIKVVVRTECGTIDEHKLYFTQLTDYYAEAYELTTKNTALSGTKPNLDPSCSNVNRLCFLPYDPDVFFSPNSEIMPLLEEYRLKAKADLPPNYISSDAPKYANTEDNTNQRIVKAIARLQESRTDLTQSYDDWVKIGLAFASIGENGRSYYHDVSRLNPKYSYEETDSKFNGFLRSGNGKVTIGTFFNSVEEVLGKVGYDPSSNYKKYSDDSRSDSHPVTSGEWPPPQPIEQQLLSVLSVTQDMLPEPLRPWLLDISNRMKCPLDFVAATAVVMLSSLIGTRLTIMPKSRDDWALVPNLWGVVIGDPSMMKTPAVNEVLKPLKRLIAESKKQFDQEKHRYETEQADFEIQKKVYSSQQQDRLKGGSIKNPVEFPQIPKKPVHKRHMVNDATVEKLVELLKDNPTGLLQYRDELVGLFAAWERAGRESDRAFYLEGWNGDGSKGDDRIGRGDVYADNVCLSLFGAIQPAKLLGYLQAATSYDNDGFVQRLQVAVYPDKSIWSWVDENPDTEARDRAYALIKKIDESDFKTISYDADYSNKFPYTRFERQALEIFKKWLTDLETKVLLEETNDLLVEHFTKYRSLMPSLALIFHVVNTIDSPNPTNQSKKQLVTVEAANMAIRWCDYLMSHARRIYGLLDTIGAKSAKELVRHLKKGDLKDGFKVRDVYRKQWTYLTNKEQAEAAIMELITRNYLKEVQPPSPKDGRPESTSYLINPKI